MTSAARPAFVLPVVLVLIGLLALTMAGFTFFMRAEIAGAQAQRDGQQARLAAESGLEEVKLLLRKSRDDPSAWWNAPERFRHALVWSERYTREEDPVRKMGSRKDILALANPIPAWRYSVVAEDLDGLPGTIRYGITPEASKLNLNSASDAEIERLLTPLLLDLRIENAPELVAALLDWRDADEDVRPGGAEAEYYNTLQPPYLPKNGPLDTVEELLLVEGFNAAVLYGEDVNRNGILDANEDDGDARFPYYDNADGVLNRGIAPYVTVWSREVGADKKNKAGLVNINTAPLLVLEALDGMAPEGAEAIVARRAELDTATLQSPNWPLQEGVVDAAGFAALQKRITTKALQFHVEIVGYADHTKLARRDEWVIEMRGPLAQVLYHRDLTPLGLAWPVDDETVVVTSPRAAAQ